MKKRERAAPALSPADHPTTRDRELWVDDVLDDLGELVLSKRGKVVVVPSGRMPTKMGAAATCRF